MRQSPKSIAFPSLDCRRRKSSASDRPGEAKKKSKIYETPRQIGPQVKLWPSDSPGNDSDRERERARGCWNTAVPAYARIPSTVTDSHPTHDDLNSGPKMYERPSAQSTVKHVKQHGVRARVFLVCRSGTLCVLCALRTMRAG